MSDILNYTFKYSEPLDIKDPQEGYFSTMPVRSSKFKEEISKGSAELADDWFKEFGQEIPKHATLWTESGHCAQWMCAEWPPRTLAIAAKLMELTVIWDGEFQKLGVPSYF